MLFFLFFLSLSEAALYPNIENILGNLFPKSSSAKDLRTVTSKEKLTKSDSHTTLSIRSNPSSDSLKSFSSPREYIPSKPIPILFPKVEIEHLESDVLDQKHFNRYKYFDSYSSDSSDSDLSSYGSSPEDFFIFEMSYDPNYEAMRKLRREERKKRRQLERKSKNEENKEVAEKNSKPLYYSDEDEEEMLEKRSRERTRGSRYASFAELDKGPVNSDLDSDSDCSIEAKEREESKNLRKLKMDSKNEENQNVVGKKSEPFYYSDENEEEMIEHRNRERTRGFRCASIAELDKEPVNSDLDNDSDFGIEARKEGEPCYSLSF